VDCCVAMPRKNKSQVIRSRGPVTAHGVTVQEWQRTPKQLLNEACQSLKRPRPQFRRAPCRAEGRFRARLVLPDPRNVSEKDIVLCPVEDFETRMEAENAAALLGLHALDPSRPHERRLPEPYRSAWLALTGNSNSKDAQAPSKAKKKSSGNSEAAEAQYACRFCGKAFKKEHAEKGHVKQMHAEDVAAELKAQEDEDESVKDDEVGDGDGETDSLFDFSADRRKVAESASTSSNSSPKKEAFTVTKQGKFSNKYERRVHEEKRQQDRRVKNRKREQIKESNPYVQVFMSDEHRNFVEKVIKSFGESPSESSAQVSESSQSFQDLIALGFRETDVKQALQQCGDGEPKEVYLDWICIYAPEEYLPEGFDPRGKQLEVLSLREKGGAGSTMEASLHLLFDAVGSPKINLADMSPSKIIEELLHTFADFHGMHVGSAWPLKRHTAEPISVKEARQMREDEVLALESMFGSGEIFSERGIEITLINKRAKVSHHVIKIGELDGVPGESLIEFITLEESETDFCVYPDQPSVALFHNPALNRHVNMNMTLRMSQQALELQSAPQLFELYDLVQTVVAGEVAARNTFPFKQSSGTGSRKAIDEGMTLSSASELLKGSIEASKLPQSSSRRSGTVRETGKRFDNSLVLKEEQAKKRTSSQAYQKMIEMRAKLPASQHLHEVLVEIDQNQVVLISGETGCGKTTQVPQFILDDAIENNRGGKVNIICTQPRRLAAIGVANRVSEERCEPRIGGTVGYQIRLENKTSSRTRLSFVTTGILLRRLQSDEMLQGVTHILVDEVHERSVETDFLLAILKRVLVKRTDLKLLLMSATMDSDIFCEYFSTTSVVKIPGFVHPVKDFFLEEIVQRLNFPLQVRQGPDETMEQAHSREMNKLEKFLDFDLIANLVVEIDRENVSTDGSVLIFMSGVGEIQKAIRAIERASKSNPLMVLPLHGALSGKEQSKVFNRAPKGMRKVVVSTNVAETSITIDDVFFVIDSGRMKETRYDPVNRMSQLVEDWVSRNSARQRRGRAGRVQPGECFKLYTEKRHNLHFSQAQVPEIHRVPLEQLVLQVLSSDLGQPLCFMQTLMEPPPSVSVTEAVRLLLDVGAADILDKRAQKVHLTALGRHLARLPMDVRIGKLLIFGCLLQCAEQVLTIAAGLNVRNPFVSPQDKREEADAAKKALLGGESVAVTQSDHICLLYAYERWDACDSERARRKFAEEFFLSHQSMAEMRDLRKDFRKTLRELGFDATSSTRPKQNERSQILSRESVSLVKAAVCAGLYPNVINVKKPIQKFSETQSGSISRAPEAQQLRMLTPRVEDTKDDHSIEPNKGVRIGPDGRLDLERVFLHPQSVLFSQREYRNPWLVYREKVKTSKVFVRDATAVPPYSLLLFGGNIDVQHERKLLCIDGWIHFRAQPRVGVLVRELRRVLDRLLDEKIVNPNLDISNTDVLLAIKKLLIGSGFSIT